MNRLNRRGITLIELLVALVICAIVIAAIYRVFIAQSRAYVVQDQVVEVQQNIRTAMEMMVRDIRMAGFDYDNDNSPQKIPNLPYLITENDGKPTITVWYEYYKPGDKLHGIHQVTYTLNGTNLERQCEITPPPPKGPIQTNDPRFLENVERFELTCGTDGIIGDYSTQDGVVDNWINCGAVNNRKVIAVRVTLTTRPEQVDAQDDRFSAVSPRTLTSTVALRNLAIKQF